jgi:hypothetical protein
VFAYLLTLWGLFRLGRRRSPEHGAWLCLAWSLFPVTALPSLFSANESMTVAMVVLALAFHERPLLAGILLGLASVALMFPVLLVPAFLVSYPRVQVGFQERPVRDVQRAAPAGCAARRSRTAGSRPRRGLPGARLVALALDRPLLDGPARRRFVAGVACAVAIPVAYLAGRGELSMYLNVAVGQVDSGIDWSFWWTIGADGVRRVLIWVPPLASVVPAVLYWKRGLSRAQLLRTELALASMMLFVHRGQHLALVQVPVTLLLIELFAGAPAAPPEPTGHPASSAGAVPGGSGRGARD